MYQISDGMEIMVLSILGPVLLCEWNLSTWQEAFLTTVSIQTKYTKQH